MTALVHCLGEEYDVAHELKPQQWRKTVVQKEVGGNGYNNRPS
jgi:hypothetical protein